MTNLINTNLSTLTAENLKKLAKEYKVKNWWLLKKTELLEVLTLIQEEAKEETHTTEEDVKEMIHQAAKELGIELETREENPLVPMPGTQDPNWGEKAAGKAPKKAKKEKTPKVEKNEDNLVTLKELAAEYHMKGTKARRLLRNETAARPFGGNRWEWDKDLHKAELELARSILKAHTK